VAIDGAGNLYFADLGNNRIRNVSPAGTITTMAGGGSPASGNGDGGTATGAKLSAPAGVTVDATGNLYISEGGLGASRIRKVSANGTISTITGNGSSSFSGDGGPATSAALNTPLGIALDRAGNLYIADGGNSRVRKVSVSGIITTVAGNGSLSFSGDGGPGPSAGLNVPTWVATDSAGNLYINDGGNERVRRVNAAGIISTIAGDGVLRTTGDGRCCNGTKKTNLGPPQTRRDEPASILFLDFLRYYLPFLQPVYLGFGTGLFKPLVYGCIAGTFGGQHGCAQAFRTCQTLR
jgi:sugar lactone lactonase YvrE